MRLIDADRLDRNWSDCGTYQVVRDKDIENAPTIDAEPVVHAYWIYHGSTSRCSRCMAAHGNYGFEFCPTCGARMDADAPERGGEDKHVSG